jgi:hypothetical protein
MMPETRELSATASHRRGQQMNRLWQNGQLRANLTMEVDEQMGSVSAMLSPPHDPCMSPTNGPRGLVFMSLDEETLVVLSLWYPMASRHDQLCRSERHFHTLPVKLLESMKRSQNPQESLPRDSKTEEYPGSNFGVWGFLTSDIKESTLGRLQRYTSEHAAI